MNILLLYENSEFARAIEVELTAAFGCEMQLRSANNEKMARRLLPGDYHLVITPLHIRETAASPLLLAQETGIKLLEWMRSSGMIIPGILITPPYSDEQRNHALPKDCYEVVTNGNYIQEVAQYAKQMMGNGINKCLDIEIELSRTNKTFGKSIWEYHLLGKGFKYRKEGRLEIDEGTVENLLILSKALGSADGWPQLLQNIRKQLLEYLYRKEGLFLRDITIGLEDAGGERNARVRFVVERNMHDIALEALPCPMTEDWYWMLEVPMYRRLPLIGRGGDMFEGGQRFDCLIIDASVAGWDAQLNWDLPQLKNASVECSNLRNWLGTKKDEFNIGRVEFVNADETGEALSERIKKLLEKNKWGLVHYAGHSYYNAHSETGYVFFPGRDKGSIEKVELKRFSDWLRNTSFVYFSSCESGAGTFVFELANRGIQNIIGFRWEIEDEFALEYAKEFYEYLFQKRSIEMAFFQARRRMYERHCESRIWAAPVLIEQA